MLTFWSVQTRTSQYPRSMSFSRRERPMIVDDSSGKRWMAAGTSCIRNLPRSGCNSSVCADTISPKVRTIWRHTSPRRKCCRSIAEDNSTRLWYAWLPNPGNALTMMFDSSCIETLKWKHVPMVKLSQLLAQVVSRWVHRTVKGSPIRRRQKLMWARSLTTWKLHGTIETVCRNCSAVFHPTNVNRVPFFVINSPDAQLEHGNYADSVSPYHE